MAPRMAVCKTTPGVEAKATPTQTQFSKKYVNMAIWPHIAGINTPGGGPDARICEDKKKTDTIYLSYEGRFKQAK